jgi:hypothetical protein
MMSSNEFRFTADNVRLTRVLGPRSRHRLILVSALLMAALGVYQLVAGIFRAEVVPPGG